MNTLCAKSKQMTIDVKIEAPGHPHQEALHVYYEETLQKKYAPYDFIKAVDVKIHKDALEKSEVTLLIKPENMLNGLK